MADRADVKRVILDFDVGNDDAVALFILLKADSEKIIKIEAICCSMGNSSLENICRNVVRLLEIAGRTDIPVYRGAVEQIIYNPKRIDFFHGIDGFGDLKHDKEPDVSIIKDEPSPVAMYNVAKKYKNEIYLICLGPLTNPALAMKLYPDFADFLKEIYVMGGNHKAQGNTTKTAEFNFHTDPEAAHIVLNRAKCPIVLLTWEACLHIKIDFDWRYNVFGNTENPYIQLLNKADQSVYGRAKVEYWTPCDGFLAAIFVFPDIVHTAVNYNGTVELHGAETRGQMVLDHLHADTDNIKLIKYISVDKFKSILMWARTI